MTQTDSDAAPASDVCPLPWPAQRRNLTVFALCTGMQYLAAPLLYVGVTQGALGRRLEADTRSANLSQTLFHAMMAVPAIIAWLSPRASVLKRNLSLCYFAVGLMQAVVALTLLSDASNRLKLSVVILQGGVAGALVSTAIALLWEIVARGTDESRRGLALGLAFGMGPMFAVVGSFLQAVIVGGDLYAWSFPGFEYPWNFALLFGLGAPVMWMAALLGQFCVVPPATVEAVREPVRKVVGLLVGVPAMLAAVFLLQYASSLSQAGGVETSSAAASGMSQAEWGSACRVGGYLMIALATGAVAYHFRSILQTRVLLVITIVTILLYTSSGITTNLNLYSESVFGNLPERYAGVQNMLRFSFKMATGLVLGWLLTRTNPRTGLLATAFLLILSQAWAICATGPTYLIAFGLFGAGELVGVYAPNYIVSASRRDELRRNMAYATLLMVPAAPAGYFYGAIVDFAKSHGWTALGMTSTSFGFRLSFAACGAVILTGVILALTLLPPKPRPDDAPRNPET